MRGSGRVVPLALTLGLSLACGPDANLDDGGGSSGEGSTAATPAAETQGSVADDTSTGGNGTDTGVEPPGTYEEDDGGTGCTFTCPDPPNPPNPPGGGGFFECNLALQDCPEGEKCMPWANDGGDQWNSTRCAPLYDDPAQAGEECRVEGSGTSGIDTCDIDVLCWQVDPATNEGYCFDLCGGSPCEQADHACVTFPGDVPLCVQACDPSASECGEGEGCYLNGSNFVCHPPMDEAPAVGEPCVGAQTCAPGALCAYDRELECGAKAGEGCCATVCDVADMDACGMGQVCDPWFRVAPPPELAHIGVCV